MNIAKLKQLISKASFPTEVDKQAALDCVDEVKNFSLELIDHLDYCGWGDKWERECSEELRGKAQTFREQI